MADVPEHRALNQNEALAKVERDLTTCVRGAPRLQFIPIASPGILVVGLIDGRYWSGARPLVQSQMWSVGDIASCAQDSIGEVLGYPWPICKAHGRELTPDVAGLSWFCGGPDEHVVAAIGELVASEVLVHDLA